MTTKRTLRTMLANYRTTVAGVVSILSGIVIILRPLADGEQDWAAGLEEGLALIVVGAGLLSARDAQVTSETSGAR